MTIISAYIYILKYRWSIKQNIDGKYYLVTPLFIDDERYYIDL